MRLRDGTEIEQRSWIEECIRDIGELCGGISQGVWKTRLKGDIVMEGYREAYRQPTPHPASGE